MFWQLRCASPPVASVDYQVGFHRAGTTSRCTVTLVVEPWVPAETVAPVYRGVQQELVGPRCVRLQMRDIELFRFGVQAVDRRPDGEESAESWRTIMAEWNMAHPNWRYNDPRNFRRALKRAVREVRLPGRVSVMERPRRRIRQGRLED